MSSKPSDRSEIHGNRILAVDHVHLEAPLGCEEELRWFYGELAGLDEQPPEGDDGTLLRFRDAEWEVRITLTAEPKTEATAERVTLAVASLFEAKEMLIERKIRFEQISGTTWTDRRLSVLDPAGNRVGIKRYWPRVF